MCINFVITKIGKRIHLQIKQQVIPISTSCVCCVLTLVVGGGVLYFHYNHMKIQGNGQGRVQMLDTPLVVSLVVIAITRSKTAR